ncbi:MAG TPA: ABC transporter permease subunit [Planctomycetota bacterium]|nr:ABC transporter permease subunit [Planctomycetota bacterium]
MADGATTGPDIDAARFSTARATLAADRFMTVFIKTGGVGVIIAVFGIFVFILWKVIPLFRPARVELASTYGLGTIAPADVLAIGVDEWGSTPFALRRDGVVAFAHGEDGRAVAEIATGMTVACAALRPQDLLLAVGGDDGRAAMVQIEYAAEVIDGVRSMTPSIAVTPIGGLPAEPIRAIAHGGEGDAAVLAVIQGAPGGAPSARAALLPEAGEDGEALTPTIVDLTARIDGEARHILVDDDGENVVIANHSGWCWSFARDDDDFVLRQTPFRPFGDRADATIASMGWLFGDVSLVFAGGDGANRVYSLYPHAGGGRLFGRTKELDALPGAATAYAHGTRNKSFLLGADRALSLRFATTEDVRWERELDHTPIRLAVSGKNEHIASLGDDGRMRVYHLADAHPEGGLAAFFSAIWYEGSSAPRYEWQSSSATDDSEPKLSLVPIIFGTLKGTFYALLFAVPIALLGAMYTAEFMSPRLKQVVKPAMEIMASLPSVVLGFLAAQWLAPAIETRVPAILVLIVLLPTVACAFGWAWSRQSPRMRARLKPGSEWLALMPVMLLTAWASWRIGTWLDGALFGGDFRAWWPRVTDSPFEQRNSLVVGFMMGFAVIPIIFTIAEDSLANVPKSLRSASLALGATRWQTAMRVVTPTASAGIFSALMIGFGRAIGETMIMVMATGNTPIMEWNIFNGLRTITATIAVELPEHPENSTVFRTLYFAALLLFLLTFVINTAAELLRQRLREKYRTV